MRRAEYDWKTLVELGAADIVAGLQAPTVRGVDLKLITGAFAEALAADGLDPRSPMTVRWAEPPPHRDAYVFEQADADNMDQVAYNASVGSV